jgi:hypothetical protein
MQPDGPTPDPELPDAATVHVDRGSLQGAHGRTGRLLKNAGLPFEAEEFEAADDDSTSSSSSSTGDETE